MKDGKKTVVVKSFPNEAEARLAHLNLEAMGIDAHIQKDDCGGAYPQLQTTEGVHLVVDQADAERAETILNERVSDDLKPLKNDQQSKARVLWSAFVIGVIIGAFFTTTTVAVLNKEPSNENSVLDYDNNDDGSPDEFHFIKQGKLVKIEDDRNYDGRIDAWSYYKSDNIIRSEYDDNFDGSADGWGTYQDRNNFTIQYDNDHDGTADVTFYFVNGLKHRADWHPGGSSTILRRVSYKNAIQSKAHIDNNNDGQFDVTLIYDAFENEVSRTAYGE